MALDRGKATTKGLAANGSGGDGCTGAPRAQSSSRARRSAASTGAPVLIRALSAQARKVSRTGLPRGEGSCASSGMRKRDPRSARCHTNSRTPRNRRRSSNSSSALFVSAVPISFPSPSPSPSPSLLNSLASPSPRSSRIQVHDQRCEAAARVGFARET